MDTTSRTALIATATVVAAAAFLVAGPLNPPAGPVSAGGKTTQEIYDAVTGLSGNIGAVGGRGPAVPGANIPAGGTISVSGGPPGTFSSAITGMRLAGSATFSSGGGGSGTIRTLNPVTVTREIRSGTTRSFRLFAAGSPVQSVTITIPSTGGNTVYAMTDARVLGFRNYYIQRADGTMAAMEEIDFGVATLTVTDPSGESYVWNIASGQ